jgi:MFS family permease
LSLAYTIGARLAPPERSAFTLSTLASGGQLGGALAPMFAGVLGQYSLRAVFVANCAAYLIALAMTALLPSPREPGGRSEPRTEGTAGEAAPPRGGH